MARAFLRVVGGPKQGLTIPLREDQPLLIGRVRGDVRLDDVLVSGAHCRVVFRNGHFVLQDLGSTNGTMVDGRRIQDVVLRPGSEIVVGTTKLLLFGNEDEVEPSANAEDGVAWLLDEELSGSSDHSDGLAQTLRIPAGFEARVKVLAGPDKGKEYPFPRGSLAIGRGQGEVPLSDAEVSRRHAYVEVFGASMLFLRDLGSTNGTYHNGRRVQVARLHAGDTLGVGKTVMKLLIGPA